MAWYIGVRGKQVLGRKESSGPLDAQTMQAQMLIEVSEEVYNFYGTHDGNVEWNGTELIVPPPPPPAPPIPYESKVSALWNAANEYQSSHISGAALSLLTIGVLQGKPKSVAIQNWIKVIWVEYYTRKYGIPALGPYEMPNLDFTSFGEMPYSVPELMQEVGA